MTPRPFAAWLKGVAVGDVNLEEQRNFQSGGRGAMRGGKQTALARVQAWLNV